MSNSQVSRVQLNQDGTINLEVNVYGFDEGAPVEISGYVTQANGAVASFYSVYEIPAHNGESVTVTLGSVPVSSPKKFAAGFPITVIARVAEVWITTLVADEDAGSGEGIVGSGPLPGIWKSNYYSPAVSLYLGLSGDQRGD
jgi:hypothetical protein